MRKVNLFKCFIFGVFWGVVAILVSIIMADNKGYKLDEVLFIVGIIVIGIGLFSLVGGDPMGLSLNGLGTQEGQYTSNANLEIARKEDGLGLNSRKAMIKIGRSSIAIIVGGIIPTFVSFIV